MPGHMPGFTAEASLSQAEGLYQRPNYSGLAIDSSAVFPQIGTRYCMCDGGGNNCHCWFQTPWGGGGPIFEN
jgi:hypothetical protein